ncbi:MAG: methyl-accepting chemotaxis protein [Bacillota bacterium]
MSINQAIMSKFALIFLSVVLLFGLVGGSVLHVTETKVVVADYNDEKAMLYEVGLSHYDWATDLMHHINTGNDFAKTLDPRTCALGLFIYGDHSNTESHMTDFITVVEPLHAAVHQAGTKITTLSFLNDLTESEINFLTNSDRTYYYQKDKAEKLQIYEDEVDANLVILESMIHSVIDEIDIKIAESEEALDAVINLAVISCCFVIWFIIAATVGAMRFIKTEIINPILHLEKGARKLAKGQLAIDFICDSKAAEMEHLSESLHTSVLGLKQLVNGIQDSVGAMADKDFSHSPEMVYPGDFRAIEVSLAQLIEVIRETMSEIQVAAQQVTTGSEQVSAGAQALAHGTMDQTSSVDQLCEIVEDVSTKINETANNAVEANELGKTAVAVVEQSSSEMGQLMDAMKQIEESSAYIEEIIKTIDDIAFQTNILALNAAVEAARAGQAGKGFAVVADEVRNLAQKSAEAAQNTTSLIETSLQAIQTGTDLTNSTSETFDNVVKNTEHVLAVVSKIAAASEAQLQSVGRITDSVAQISAVVQSNSATSEESAAASEELSSQANMMKTLISEFQLGD